MRRLYRRFVNVILDELRSADVLAVVDEMHAVQAHPPSLRQTGGERPDLDQLLILYAIWAAGAIRHPGAGPITGSHGPSPPDFKMLEEIDWINPVRSWRLETAD